MALGLLLVMFFHWPRAVAAVEVSDLERETMGVWPYRPLRNFKEGLRLLIDPQNQWTIGGGLAATLVARDLDEEAQSYFNKKRRIGDLQNLGNHYLGTGAPGVILGAGLWVFGGMTHDWYHAQAGQAQLEALLTAGILTAALKGAVGRRRPDNSERFSFPSGHTSTVFTSAMVLQEFYGWKIGVPMFLLGTLTAVSRLSENRHWLSDTVAGATLGIVVGHAFARAHLDRFQTFDERKNVARKWSLYPMLEPEGGGLVFQMAF